MAQGPWTTARQVSRERRTVRRSLLALVAGAVLAGTVAGPATAATPNTRTGVPTAGAEPAGQPPSFGIEPLPALTRAGTGVGDPRSAQYIVEDVRPGTVLTRVVQVFADDAERLPLSVYPAAAGVAGGDFEFAPGRTANDLSSWTTLDRAAVAPSRGSPVTVRVTIAVPADARPGERYGVVWAESTGADPAPGGSMTGGIRTVNRAGVRMYVYVPAAGSAARDGLTPPAGRTGVAGADAVERTRSEPVGSAVASLVPALVAAAAALVLAARFAAARRRARPRGKAHGSES
ncbi:hypothetical protein I6A60_30280 [Frankia sp. AgB1.9]|uniref:hypothetical protein n=1 Tax=unclassified Frankia TaxID=2632575 RepID=UPI001932AF9F|nr:MULTISPECIES: hypothetical protein [unclassified Frankia]MBL7492177.1 hypothetical protein [Frankia sp. AgW1.1]MBL7552117.1 hypothetical protein [Frankia sp. AgB1.9]MBL7622164.1 hypothetical protein [Frankia sp. AgB1.8]